jgi:hypothetical protein
LIINGAEAVVVDYKSSKPKDESYSEQVKEYLRIINEIYPRHKARGVIIYLDSLTRENIDG